MAARDKPLRLLFLGFAGVSTFVVSAQLAGSRAGGNEPVAEAAMRAPQPAVAPVPMAAAAPAASASVAGSAPGASSENTWRLGDRARAIPRTEGELFANQVWQKPPPPPPPAPPPPPPPPPTAPPLPFTFIGMLERGTAKPEAFLAKADALLVVSVGDVLDNNTYRVETLTPNEVVMTYLPLNIRQTLLASGANR